MSDMERLLDGDGDELERSLLEAIRDDEEDRARMKRTLGALGLGFPGPGPTPTDGGAAASGGALTKWIVLGAIGGAVGIGAIAATTRQPEPALAPALVSSAAEVEPTPSQRVPAPPPALTRTPAPAPTPTPSTEPAPPRRSSPAPAVSSATPPKPGASELKREIAALDRARAALRSGDTQRARKELDRYDYEFPFGYLGPEARALRARLDKKDDAGKNE